MKASIYISGRTMLEMIGTLAIIGILSIGSFFLYNKTIQKHHINQAIYFFNRAYLASLELCGWGNSCPLIYIDYTKNKEILCRAIGNDKGVCQTSSGWGWPGLQGLKYKNRGTGWLYYPISPKKDYICIQMRFVSPEMCERLFLSSIPFDWAYPTAKHNSMSPPKNSPDGHLTREQRKTLASYCLEDAHQEDPDLSVCWKVK